jgi:hypothetical protein
LHSSCFAYSLITLAANNLYGWAQSQLLPVGDYKWLSPKKIEQLDISNLPIDGKYGYTFEVDLYYPSELHAAHSSFPLAPHKMQINEEQLSPYAKGKPF